MSEKIKIYNLTCYNCDKEFKSTNPRTKGCCEYCRDEIRKATDRERRLKNKIKEKKPNEELVAMGIRAKELGMSYGEYSAMLYEQNMKWGKKSGENNNY